VRLEDALQRRGSRTSSTRRRGPVWEASWQPCCSRAPFFFSTVDPAECAAHDFRLREAERPRSLAAACTRGRALAWARQSRRGLLARTDGLQVGAHEGRGLARRCQHATSSTGTNRELHRPGRALHGPWRRRTPPAASWCIGACAAACSFVLLVSSMGSTGRGWRPTDISALSFILRIGVLGLQVLARARGGGGVGCSPTRPATTCSLQGQQPRAPRHSRVQAAAGERGCFPLRVGQAAAPLTHRSPWAVLSRRGRARSDGGDGDSTSVCLPVGIRA